MKYTIEREAIETAQRTVEERIQETKEAMQNGTPEEIKAAIHRELEAIRAHRTLVSMSI